MNYIKKLSSMVFLAFTIITALAISASAEPEIGKTAPQFSVTDTNGKLQNLKDYIGKTVVLEWTNHECPFVRKHYGAENMQALQKEATSKNIVWLSIISSAPGLQGYVEAKEANKLTVSRKASPTAVILDPDGEIGKAFNATATPGMFIIDKTGKLVYKGAIDDKPSANPADIKTAKNYVQLALKAIAEDKPIERAITRPYGCSVKYGS